MATNNKKIFYISTESSVSDHSNIEVPLGHSRGACGSPQDEVEPKRQVAVGVEAPQDDDRAPLVNAADPAEGNSPQETTTANETCCDRYIEWADDVANSWMMITLLVPMLIGSILFIYMGASYYHQCPFFPHFPLMTIIMGAAGALAILMRIVRIIVTRGMDQPDHYILRYLTHNGFLMFLVLFVLELGMYAFSDGYPSKDTQDTETYCNDMFYSFLESSFAVVIALMLIIGVIYVPLVHRLLRPLYPTEQAYVNNDF